MNFIWIYQNNTLTEWMHFYHFLCLVSFHGMEIYVLQEWGRKMWEGWGHSLWFISVTYVFILFFFHLSARNIFLLIAFLNSIDTCVLDFYLKKSVFSLYNLSFNSRHDQMDSGITCTSYCYTLISRLGI